VGDRLIDRSDGLQVLQLMKFSLNFGTI
jgi:hypothetical protein